MEARARDLRVGMVAARQRRRAHSPLPGKRRFARAPVPVRAPTMRFVLELNDSQAQVTSVFVAAPWWGIHVEKAVDEPRQNALLPAAIPRSGPLCGAARGYSGAASGLTPTRSRLGVGYRYSRCPPRRCVWWVGPAGACTRPGRGHSGVRVPPRVPTGGTRWGARELRLVAPAGGRAEQGLLLDCGSRLRARRGGREEEEKDLTGPRNSGEKMRESLPAWPSKGAG